MAALELAHRGYEYQDLLVACRLVDVMLGSIKTAHVDEKFVLEDRFDDLTTVDEAGHRERVQVKYTADIDRLLTLATFTNDVRQLRLDRLLATAMADRDGPGIGATESSFRIVLRDAVPTDARLLDILKPTASDPGPFVRGMNSVRMSFHADALWEAAENLASGQPHNGMPLAFLRANPGAVTRRDLDWFCEHLVVELNAPAATFDLINPGAAEHLLLKRVRDEVGTGIYPNADRSDVDVAAALIGCARAARQGSLTVTVPELLRRTQLRSDFGAVARRHPVNSKLEVPRSPTVSDLVQQAIDAADEEKAILLIGPPGQGKSWVCKQVVKSLSEQDWLVAEHYCYLGEADGERLPRVHAESVLGSLLGIIAECDPNLVSEQRPRFAAHEQAVEHAVAAALEIEPHRRVALVVDGIDHVTRVIGGGGAVDPSFALAQVLASLHLPKGSTLIVLSQPGTHLRPLEEAGAVTVHLLGLTDSELRQLAVHLGVIGARSDSAESIFAPLRYNRAEADEFVDALSDRSSGNALYATYLCREALRSPTTTAEPSATVRSLPPFDGSLCAYYEHIQTSLGPQAAWVADLIALIDFPVSREELKQIRPDSAHRVDKAVDVLRPVLWEHAAQGGIRIYHESFARFLRQPFQDDPTARAALLNRIIQWLEGKGMFNDPCAFRYLLRTLSEANRYQRVVDTVGRDFVIESISYGFPASAIIENLATAIDSAARVGDWPAVVRYVEMSRSAETYQEERFESAILDFSDVVGSLLGAETLAERLLHDGRPTMAARPGLQMCTVLDAMGAVPPWREYMLAFMKENENDNTSYGEDSDRAVVTAWLRGRLRLASLASAQPPDSGNSSAMSSAQDDGDGDLLKPVQWERLATWVDERDLSPIEVVDAVFDTFGLSAVVGLIEKVAHPGAYCVALAESVDSGRISDSEHDAFYWALQAASYDIPAGSVSRLLAFGMDVGDIDPRPLEETRARLEQLTRNVQDYRRYQETTRVAEWIDACTMAARNDLIGLNAAEALLEGPGWYTCWLRFVIDFVIAEAKLVEEQSQAALQALRILTEVKNPFLGDPRACDLYPIHGLIRQTIWRAVHLLDDQGWKEGIELLNCVSDATSTTIRGEMGGPLPRDVLLHLTVDTATSARQAAAQALVGKEIESGGGGRYYSDLAEYRLLAARLALNAGDITEARYHWEDACRLLTAYGWHKDVTIYELLDPLPTLISLDRARGRAAVAKLQGLCERIPQHTDGKETRHTWSLWWELLASADPCALAKLIAPRLLGSCNDPNQLLHKARSDLWRAWYHQADPIVAGALRLTLEKSLDENDPHALGLLADESDGSGRDEPARLLIALLGRTDERPIRYRYSNGDEFLDRDRKRVDSLNAVAARAAVPRVASLPTFVSQAADPTTFSGGRKSPPGVHLPDQSAMTFPPSVDGLARAIRSWRDRRYDETRPGWATDRFVNVLGYRIVELAEAGHTSDAETTLRLIADAGGFDDRSGLLKALAEGLERHGQRRLAAVAYTLTWTRRRGGGGWEAFGGETELESLQRATNIDPALVLSTVAEEVERVVAQGLGSLGVTQALVYGFAKGGLDVSDPFDIWNEAFAIIADRAPRVADIDDPDDVYVAPYLDEGANLLGDIDAAFVAATVAGLAHPGREQKRRSLMAVQLLIDQRTTTVAPALKSALLSLSDPATLTWLLRVIEIAGDKAVPITATCRKALIKLAQGSWLTVRVLARRLLSSDDIPSVPYSEPDRALLDDDFGVLSPPTGIDCGESPTGTDSIVGAQAGVRLSRAELALPGLREAVCSRVDAARKGEQLSERMQIQVRALRSMSEKHWPDAFLAWNEAIEDAIQRVSAGARAVRLMRGEPFVDPFELEQSLAKALLDDPRLPLALERTRQPRPNLPPPPPRGDSLWRALHVCAEGRGVGEADVLAASHDGRYLIGTVAIMGTEGVPVLKGGPYSGWWVVASVEQRAIAKDNMGSDEDDVARRYRVIEVRTKGDQQALTLPPISKGDLRAWSTVPWSTPSVCDGISTRPVVGLDPLVRAADDGHSGLGIQCDLLTPTPWLATVLGLTRGSDFVLDDRHGEAVALVTWRTEYETSEYELTWPRLYGAGLVVRDDVFDGLIHAAQGLLTFRDFIEGSSSLCG